MSERSPYGWEGRKVRNPDGRSGTIEHETGFGPWLDLRIKCDDGTVDVVKLNARGPDSGSEGWQWWSPEFARGPAWLPLGDKGSPLTYSDPSHPAKS